MDGIADGDRIFVAPGAKHLRSSCCMCELFEIGRESQRRRDERHPRAVR